MIFLNYSSNLNPLKVWSGSHWRFSLNLVHMNEGSFIVQECPGFANHICKSSPSALHLLKVWNIRCLVPTRKGNPTGAARWLDILALPVATNFTLGFLLQYSRSVIMVCNDLHKRRDPRILSSGFQPANILGKRLFEVEKAYKTPLQENLHSQLATARCFMSHCVLLHLLFFVHVGCKLFRAGTVFCCMLVQCSGLAWYP